MGNVRWTVDAQSCIGSATIDFFVDGGRVGSETLTAGGTSRSYAVVAGTHVLGASVSNGAGYVWPSQTEPVPSGSTFTLVLKC